MSLWLWAFAEGSLSAGLVLAAASDATDPWAAVVSYGVAAPLVYFLYRSQQKALAERDAERARTETLTRQLIELQATMLPVVTRATEVIQAQKGTV